MSAFDLQTERCSECDGHWRHYHPCSYLNCPTLPGGGYDYSNPECDRLGTNHSHPAQDPMCECGLRYDVSEQEGDCIDCGMEWAEEERNLHFGAVGMFCCSCAQSRRDGDGYAQ